jgi:hypothetical protein
MPFKKGTEVPKARWLAAQEQEKKSTESAEAMKIVHLGLGITPGQRQDISSYQTLA